MAEDDTDRLVALLGAYSSALTHQREVITETFHDLTVQYAHLKTVWSGEGARDFDTSWSQTAAAFDTYQERVAPVIALLQDRLEALQRFNQGMA